VLGGFTMRARMAGCEPLVERVEPTPPLVEPAPAEPAPKAVEPTTEHSTS
jgi:hypothetical protein